MSLRMTCLLCLLAAGLPAAPPEVVARLKADVAALSGPAFKGRGNGQEGLDKAAAYIVKTFEGMGLKATVQSVPHGELHRERFAASLRETDASRPLEAGRQLDLFDSDLTLKLQDQPLLFVGYGLDHASHNDLAGLDVKGRIVVLEPPRDPRKLPGIPAETFSHPRNLLKGLIERGPALILIHHPAEGQGSLGPLNLDVPCPVGVLYKGALSGAAETAFQAARQKLDQGAIASCELPARLSVDVVQKLQQHPLPNVIATVPGTDATLKAEHIVVGAHLDHLGTAANGRMFPGADDNASGCAGVLEIARQLAQKPARRSVTFIFFGGEEAGLLGSAHWVKSPTVPLAQVKGMVNLDCIGRFQPGQQDLGLTGLGWHPEVLEKARQQAPKGLQVATDRGSTPFAYMSDHASFSAARIPAVFFFTGIHGDLHKPTDTVEKLNLDAMGDITAYAQQLARFQADADTPLTYVPRPVLGLRLAAQGSPVVKSVTPNGPGARLQLKPGDTLVKLGTTPVATKADVDRFLDTHLPGETVEVTWTRDGQTLKATGALDEPR